MAEKYLLKVLSTITLMELFIMYKNIALPIMILFLALIAGCATAITPLSVYKSGKEPTLGITTHVDVGEAIYTEFDYIEQESAYLINGYMKPFGLGKITIAPGYLLLGYLGDGKKQYCTPTLEYSPPMAGPYDIVCFSDSNNDKNSFDKIRVPTINFGSWIDINDSIPYKPGVAAAAKGTKFELLYQGIFNGTLKITYREYIDSLARPAFFQEVNYTLNPNGITNISFRRADIDVIEANNNGITYRIKDGFKNK